MKRIKFYKTIYKRKKKRPIFIKQWQNMKQIILLIVSLSLSGCAGTVYRTKLEVYCPPIQPYSPEFNQELADNLDALKEGYEAVSTAISDYAKLRDRIRACEKEKGEL